MDLAREIERLRWEKQEAEQRAERERQRAERERQRAERAEQRIKETTFHKYLALCHSNLFMRLTVQRDASKSSAGDFTRVTGKYYPLELKPWIGFPSLHEQQFNSLEEVFSDRRLFLSVTGFDTVDRILQKSPLDDEEDLKRFEFLAIEICALWVIERYLALAAGSAGGPDHFPAAIKFKNNPYGLLSGSFGDIDDPEQLPAYVPALEAVAPQCEVTDAPPSPVINARAGKKRPTSGSVSPSKRLGRPKLYPDQWCFRVDPTNRHEPLFIIEYKAAHKLSVDILKAALPQQQTDTPLFREVIYNESHSTTIADPTQKANEATAKVLVQAFHYMVYFGLQYCYVASGEALILLFLDPSDPTTLFYHLAFPKEGRPIDSGSPGAIRRSAVSLVLTMILLSLSSKPLKQSWYRTAESTLKKWPHPYDEMDLPHRSSDEEDPHPKPALPPPWQGDRHQQQGRRDGDDDDGDTDYSPQKTRSQGTSFQLERRQTRQSTRDRDRTEDNRGGGGDGGHQQARFCTQACLLGLRDGTSIDPKCPYVNFHIHGTSSQEHPITLAQFIELLQIQLREDMDNDCEALDKDGKFGEIGMLFHLHLRKYGYHIVAKGVQMAHVKEIEREAQIYAHLQPLQGSKVPVCLGILPLVYAYRSQSGANITSMLLMSYCGERCNHDDDKAALLWTQLHRYGVWHGDERPENTVWSEELQALMCIDFNRAKIRMPEAKRPPKRKREAQSNLPFLGAKATLL